MGFLTDEQISFFHENGYLLIPNFWTLETCEELRNEMKVIISQLNLHETRSIFTTKDNMDGMNRDRYFLESGDVIRYVIQFLNFDFILDTFGRKRHLMKMVIQDNHWINALIK